MVEFAILAPVFIILVAGIIQFGVAINYWLDLNRLANQGARWAAVNAYPNCGRLDPNSLHCGTNTSLQEYLACEPSPGALEPRVFISFPDGTSEAGDPVEVRLETDWELIPLIGIDLRLSAKATMRMEQRPVRYDDNAAVDPPEHGPGPPADCP